MKSWEVVQGILQRDVRHRKGWVPSSLELGLIFEHLKSEVEELGLVVKIGAARAKRSEALEEIADCNAVLKHLAQRFGFSEDEVDREEVRKLRLRFPEERSAVSTRCTTCGRDVDLEDLHGCADCGRDACRLCMDEHIHG